MLQCGNPISGPGDPILVLCACPDDALASHMARELVTSGVAACVNRLPGLTSVYRWKGQVVEEPEALLIIKTLAGRLEELEVRVRSLHPYEVPEIIAIPVSAGSAPYLSWLAEHAGGAAAGAG